MTTFWSSIRTRASVLVLVALVAAALASCGSTEPDDGLLADCVPVDHGHSVARLWNEEALDAIRRDFPAPTVHARNLYHLSTVTYDAWAAFGPQERSWLIDEQRQVDDDRLDEARDAAISFAAHRLLRHRYALATGALESVNAFNALMADLCYDIGFTSTSGDSPAAIGNRIAGLTIAQTRDDGANEDLGYEAPYESVNEPIKIARPDETLPQADPNRWQPISFENATSQNGLVIASGPQTYIGPHWGSVTPFAIAEVPDPGPPPFLGDPATDAEFKAAAVEVIRASSRLDARFEPQIDFSPSSRGNSTLGTDDGSGHEANPTTGLPYAPNEILLADWARVVAEFWADGPELGNATGPLEQDRERGQRSSRGRAAPGRKRRPARSTRVGRPHVLRPQRRAPRCGDRRMGRQGGLRLQPTDLDDPLHGRTRTVVRPRGSLVPSERAAA